MARGEAAIVAPWIATCAESPDAMEHALLRHLGGRRGQALESTPGRLEAYQDVVVGQLAKRGLALVERSPTASKAMGYTDLHAQASRLAATWADRGVAPASTIAIVMTPGIDSTVALLAALRLGAIVSFIPPRGRSFVVHRLIVLTPDFLVASPELNALLGVFSELNLPLTPTRSAIDGPPRGHAYEGSESVFRLFSPYARESFDLFDLTASDVLSALLRGAFFGVAADASDVVAWPELDDLTHEPLFTLATMLCGATRVFCKTADLLVHPEWLADLKVTLVGIGPELREYFLRVGPEAAPTIRGWLRDSTEPMAVERTHALEKRVTSARWRRSDLFHVAAAGGLLSFGTTGQTASENLAMPGPGMRWILLDLVGTGKPAVGTAGLFSRLTNDGPDRAASGFSYVKQGDGWVLGGAAAPWRYGRTYPRFEVCKAVRSLPFVEEVDVVLRGTGGNDGLATVVVFVDPSLGSVSQYRGKWLRLIRETIAYELGEMYLPDDIALLPLRPRYTNKGQFDSAWLSSEWSSGALDQKAADPIFVLFARIARMFAPPRGD